MFDNRCFVLGNYKLKSFEIAMDKKRKGFSIIRIYLNETEFIYEGIVKKAEDIYSDFFKGIPTFLSYTFEGDCVTEPKRINVIVKFNPKDGWIKIDRIDED